MGRKAWLFCWIEVGAEYVGVIQSLMRTCRLHGLNPYTYLVDVLQPIAIHPDKDIETLTPRRWKTLFADNPPRSDLYLATQ
ncbi:MAG: transposase domain-containing protein [Gammaproteobacteria bacterium]|nr:transposase domain-containing protein [Gammaproteobacteria bacterium]